MLPFLWPLLSDLCARQRSPSWYSLRKSVWEMGDVSDPNSDKHSHRKIILLRPWITLEPVPVDLHKPLLRKLTHIPPFILIPQSYSPQIERYCPIQKFVLRGFLQSIPMNDLEWQLPLAVCTVALIVVILFLLPSPHFWSKGASGFPCDFFSVGGLGGTWNTSDINNSLTSGIKFLNKVA